MCHFYNYSTKFDLTAIKLIPLLVLFAIVAFSRSAMGQSGMIAVKSSVEKIDQVLDRKTGKFLTDEQLHELFGKHRNIILDYDITKDGHKANFSFHSDSIRTGAFDHSGKYPPLNKGEQVHEFAFETLDNKKFASSKLIGKYIIIRFELVPNGRFFNEKSLLEIDNQVGLLANKDEVVAFACFMEPEKSKYDSLQLNNFNIVPGSSLFREKFGVKSTPTTLIFDSAGKLLGSYRGFDDIDLKSIIK